MITVVDLKSLNFDELRVFLTEYGEPAYRAEQVFGWLQSGVETFDEMINVPHKTKEKLFKASYISKINMVKKCESRDGTKKYLFRLFDRNITESVLLKYKHGFSACVSSQVGCKKNCTFCASGKNGWIRNLSAGEMIDQILAISKEENIKISNLVLMGIGEPLDNYDNVLNFLKIINNKFGLNIGQRHISISTCGEAEKIIDLANKKLQITLSVSLHAPNNEIRDKIMPINRRYNIKELIGACKYYVRKTKRRITFEYVLIKGLNDSVQNAHELSKLVGNILCHVNLIELNQVNESNFKPSNLQEKLAFQNALNKNRINVTLRHKFGKDINAACGQLRNESLNYES